MLPMCLGCAGLVSLPKRSAETQTCGYINFSCTDGSQRLNDINVLGDFRRLTVLVDEHAERDAVGVKAVQEILDVAADERVKAELLLVLDDPLSHGGNYIVVAVADLNQKLQETKKQKTNQKKNHMKEETYFICAQRTSQNFKCDHDFSAQRSTRMRICIVISFSLNNYWKHVL